jgi:acetyl-CoA C-acetyltransferase
MSRYLFESGATREQCAAVVVKNRGNALANPYGAHAGVLGVGDVMAAGPLASPLGLLDRSPGSDGAVVLVLASEERAKSFHGKPVWIRGGAYATETPNLESRDWGGATYARIAAERAYRMAGITDPAKEIDFAEVDDTYSYKELQHLEALGLVPKGEAGRRAAAGAFARDGVLPVNVSGGSLGVGHLLEASGLYRVAEVVWQLRGEAGPRQLAKARTGLAFGWRGVPTTTGAVVILSS